MSERDDIDDLLDDLADTLEALQRELPAGELAPSPPRPRRARDRDRTDDRDSDRDRTDDRDRNRNRGRDRSGRRRGPGTGDGPRQPRIPGPGEFLRFTEEYTIPTLIAMLEATIRSLELLRAVLRLAGGRGLPDPTGSGRSRRSRGREVVGDAGRRALDSLDTVLDDLQDAIDGQPTDPRARDLLGEARDLRAEIDDMIAGRSPAGGDDDAAVTAQGPDRDDHDAASRSGAEGRRSGGVTIDVGDGPTTDDASSTAEPDEDDGAAGDHRAAGDDGSGVDVDAELDTIKREMGKTAGTAEGGDGEAGESEDDGGDDEGDDPDGEQTGAQ